MCPRTCPSPYAQLFAHIIGLPGLSLRHVPCHVMLLAYNFSWNFAGFLRFGAGCHGLPVDVGCRAGVPRLQRVCTKCHGPAVCDERHVVFECPVLQHLREKYSRLFSGPGQTMQQFMWQSDIVGVVYYVRDSLLVLLADGEGGDRSSNQP